MEGLRAWDASHWHPECPGVLPVDIGGFAHLWCPVHRCLANLEAVAPKAKAYFNESNYPYLDAKDKSHEGVKS